MKQRTNDLLNRFWEAVEKDSTDTGEIAILLVSALQCEITELEQEAKAWNLPQTQKDFEFVKALKEKIGKNVFIATYGICETFHSVEDYSDWYREQEGGK